QRPATSSGAGQPPRPACGEAHSSESTGGPSPVPRAWHRLPCAEQVNPKYLCGNLDGDGVNLRGWLELLGNTEPLSLPSSVPSASSRGSRRFISLPIPGTLGRPSQGVGGMGSLFCVRCR